MNMLVSAHPNFQTRMYRWALSVGFLFFGLQLFNLYILHRKETIISDASVLIMCGLASLGFIADVTSWLNSRWFIKFQKSIIGKLIIWGVVAFSGACSAGTASRIVNEYSGIAAKFFPYTVAALTIACTVAVIFICLGLTSICLVLLAVVRCVVYYIRKKLNPALEDETFIDLMRALGALAIFMLWVQYNGSFYAFLSNVGPALSYSLDMDKNDPCIQYPLEVVTRLNDSLIVAARPGVSKFSFQFEKRACPLSKGFKIAESSDTAN
jgi:hypothetical protein